MKKLLILLLLLMTNQINAQKAGLLITNTNTQKEKFIKENKRIKIKTLSGGKLVGRLQIIDEHTIKLRGVVISLVDIEKIKKHPLIGSIGNTVGFLGLGAGTTILGALASDSSFSEENASDVPLYIGIGLSITCLYASTQPINLFDKGYSVNKKWQYSIKKDESKKVTRK